MEKRGRWAGRVLLASLAIAMGGWADSATPTLTERDDGGNRLPPLADAIWLERLKLAEGHEAFVSVPLGATEPRPVMVGMHGAGDRPEWACGGYRAATDAFPFIIYPRGNLEGPSSEKYVTPPAPWIEQDVSAALERLRERFGVYVAEGPLLYAGFSLGASRGARVIADRGAMFPVALLIEGAYADITPALSQRYAAAGGRRVLLGCGQAGCNARFAGAAQSLRAAGIEVRILDARTGRHNLDGPMMRALHDAWPWLVAGDPRWRKPE
jgi:predicted esterase